MCNDAANKPINCSEMNCIEQKTTHVAKTTKKQENVLFKTQITTQYTNIIR